MTWSVACSPLWQEVLGIADLGVEDDYSSAGGHSLLAARLFALVDPALRGEAAADDDFWIIRRRANLLGWSSPTVRRRVQLVALRPDGSKNFFFIHDGDGETLLYGNVARRLPKQFAVFGIEPRQLNGIPLAHARIEDMATYYLKAIRQRQPHGPYCLGGMCAGGVIAYEMARQLAAKDEDVELVEIAHFGTADDAEASGADRQGNGWDD